MTAPLYRRLLGPAFDTLPARVRELHDVTATVVWTGRADVERGGSLISRLAGAISGLPPAGRDQPLSVTFTPAGGRETWTRRFGDATFRSLQYEKGGLLRERVGPSTFLFALEASPAGLALVLRGMRVLGVPLPRVLQPSIRTFERERDGRYHFEVEARLPLAGLLVRYGGWLEPAADA